MSMNTDTPQRATAAQLAKRKIKPLGQRRPNVSTPSTPAFNNPTPFSNVDPNLVSNPFALPASNGFSFSQPANSQNTPTPSSFGNQNNASFGFFGSQTSSAPPSFNFSASTTNQQVKNPFSSFASNPESNFQGFQGNTFNNPSTGQSGQADNNNIFGNSGLGSQQTTRAESPFANNPTTSSGVFSAPAPSDSDSFAQPTSGSFFSASQPFMTGAASEEAERPADFMQMSPDGKPDAGVASSNIYNFPAPSQPDFTSCAATSAPAFTLSDSSGQANPAATSGPAFTNSGSFSQANSAATPGPAFVNNRIDHLDYPVLSTPLFTLGCQFRMNQPTASSAPAFTLGGSFNQADPASAAASSTPATFAGFSEPPPFPSTPLLSGFVAQQNNFQHPFSTSTQSMETAAVAGNGFFGGVSTPDAGASNNMFANLNTANGGAESLGTQGNSFVSQPQQPSFSNSLFGDTSRPQAIGSSTPFTSSPESKSTSASFFTPLATPAFSFSPPSKKRSFGDISGESTTSTATTAVNETSLLSSTTQPAHIKSTTPRSSSSRTEYKHFPSSFSKRPKWAETSPEEPDSAAELFRLIAETYAREKACTSSQEATASISNKPLLSSSLTSGDNTDSPPTSVFDSSISKGPAISPLNTVAEKPAEKQTDVIGSISPPVSTALGPSGSNTKTTFASTKFSGSALVDTQSSQTGVSSKKAAYTDHSTETQYDVQSDVAQLIPPEEEIPAGLNGAEKADWIKRWRFQYINASFQQQVASFDANSNDFEPLIAYYIMLRNQIGYPCFMVSQYQAISHGSSQSSCDTEIIPARDEQEKATLENEAVPSLVSSKQNDITTSTVSALKKRKADGDANEAPVGQIGKRVRFASDLNDKEDQGNTTEEFSDDEQQPSSTLRMFINSYVAAQEQEPSIQPKSLSEERSGKEPSSVSLQNTSEIMPSSVSLQETPKTMPSSVSLQNTPEIMPSSVSLQNTPNTLPSDKGVDTPPSGSRSLFDRVEKDPNGHLRREIHNEGTTSSSKKTADLTSSLMDGPKFAASFGNFGSIATPQISSAADANTGSPSRDTLKANGDTPKATPYKSSTIASTKLGLPASTFVEPSPAPAPTVSVTSVTDSTEEAEKLPQVDLTKGGAGEEDEDVKFEVRARGLKLNEGAWEIKGLGALRILKNRKSGRSRMLLRASPSGGVILNSLLFPEVEYRQRGNSVKFLVPTSQKPEQWALTVRTPAMAAELSSAMEGCKRRE
ncbi:hypothetical protein LOZ57_003583 [Ophidiomyces ophidiicola]|uniref:uncharacterized protein n=1 Tax=Ophidiomyces ophidiicola TaxID=1387563 RepID=UPI0020C2244C|nr:uncharacterized protein LOZ57_003583 [Ophidiomyces ophidiicola]KAI1946813.1 hypothetical protein LOZ57_003583 [Ophidiomyces ophidiicola]KAI2048147.1 hypothetical protein LOZ43_005425 [Ophidiomyces ophidiicola]KAI2083781.1 hypothetical protein LOZ36_005404 [Ophidiomyces ophidiicola]